MCLFTSDQRSLICTDCFNPKKLYKGTDKIIVFFPNNENTRLFYSDNENITVCGRPAICTLIGWFKSSRLCTSLSVPVHLFDAFITDKKM